ncbi:NAD-dependent succinate-semialdehyde dehydrogenase [Paracoccus onubensis]|uniref:NAD-dependent succinate-semialdehyde dehydrogenase n=1 Tax=Paracoccus onubensis TaxID=1675788 RepID=UPI00272F2DCB|nr:NAD-dependent succinate-semialdehyde dehydrogenase [Paracoccus onubensis]MDP0929674.1 NAD-dependent succinate-semialdehyde dehydrogenase [Paracoccus onubensis]
MIESVNPATGEVVARFRQHNDAEIERMLGIAVEAQRAWRRAPMEKRLSLLLSVANELRADSQNFAHLITEEIGKPITESLAEIEKCAVACEFYAANAPRFLVDEQIVSNATDSRVVFDALGVVLAIMPWNYPFWQFFRFAAPAIAAGNGAILKHAANVPRCALSIEAMIKKAGGPDGLMQTVLIPASDVERIIADDRIAAVTMTGSTQVGQIVASQAGYNLKKQVLELGGSDPFIVLPDADIATAATMAVRARFINVGQSCVNAKRFIVHEAVAEEFVTAFRKGIAALEVGDPMDPRTQIGPMARMDLCSELHDQVVRTVAGGAQLVLGGEPMEGRGFYYAPTLLDHVAPGNASFREEVFGPVASVTRCHSAEEAMTLANDTEFGLGASVWTSDSDLARRMSRDIDAGAVFINGMVASDARLPFGGIKKSGYGRELGGYGIREFTNIKTVWTGPAR